MRTSNAKYLILSLWLCGCTVHKVSRYQNTYPAQYTRTINHDSHQAFDILKAFLITQGFSFSIADKLSGIIQTHIQPVPPEQITYEKKDLSLRSPDRWYVSDIREQTEFKEVKYRFKVPEPNSQVIISLTPTGNKTDILIQNRIYYKTNMDSLRATSTGVLENQMLRLLGN